MPAVRDEGAEVMIASHNQVSIEKAVALVQQHGMNPTASGVFFGQLLGMADHLTLVLGGNGYRVSVSPPSPRTLALSQYLC